MAVWWIKDEELNSEQKSVINLDPDKSFLIVGPPGSGKTNLLLLRAKYLILAGKANILALSFTRSLEGFLASGAERYKVPPERIRTSIGWLQSFLYENGRKPAVDALDFSSKRQLLLNEARELAIKTRFKGTFECILLDEAQDYTNEELDLFRRLGKTLFVVADSRQRIYAGKDSTDELEKLVDDTRRLRYHYRNGKAICKFADMIMTGIEDYVPLSKTSRYDEESAPSSVERLSTDSLKEQIAAVVERLKLQMKAYPGEMLAVLTPRNEELNILVRAIKTSSLGPSSFVLSGQDSEPFDSEKPICLGTMHAAKGLEFRAVHIVATERVKRFQLQRNLCYTAATRTKTALTIYHSAPLPGFLESAIVSMNPPTALPKVKDVF